MKTKERFIIAAILALIAVFVAIDIVTDVQDDVRVWHMLIEATMGLIALLGIYYVLTDSIYLKHRLEQEILDFKQFREDAKAWQEEARKYLDGLSISIDQQLSKWHLTSAEKEVAFLLLKGFSLKEIGVIRKTTEKTARVQSMAVYAKSGLSGRTELSAFFLEDLLMPSNSKTVQISPTSEELNPSDFR
jgi:DNA-binding CsgD family transcriptional regulator